MPISIQMPTTSRRKRGTGKTGLERQHEYRAKKRAVDYNPPESLSRRRRLENDPAAWLRYYLTGTYPGPFAQVHLDYIADIDYIIRNGGWKAIVLPRGSGKTTVAQGMVLLAILTGKVEYAVMLAADGTAAKQMVETFKTWIQWSDRLNADYPEVCAPIRHSRGIAQAASSGAMTAHGESIYMKWLTDSLVLPNAKRIDKHGKLHLAPSANAIIDCDGITASIRGRKYDRPDGRTVRPDIAIVDDPQTPESARSATQCQYRLDAIRSDVAGLAGPGKDIRIIVPCTIIETGDLADEISDTDRTPDFLGERRPFFTSMPANMALWEQYNEVRIEGLKNRDRGAAAKAFYLANQAALGEGAEVIWMSRSGESCVNGIQWGMDQYFRLGVKSFQSELQGAPQPPEQQIKIGKAHVLACTTKTPKWTAPSDPLAVTAFVDVNPRTSGLHWAVVSWHNNMSPHCLAYGIHPERGTLVPEGASDSQEEALLFDGLRKLTEYIKAQAIRIEGQDLPGKLDLFLVDRGYKTDVVHSFCAAAQLPFTILPDAGRNAAAYLDTGANVIRARQNVHLRKRQGTSGGRFLSHNSDVLRESAQRSFIAGPGAPGGMTLHAGMHDDFAAQICSVRLTDKAEGTRGVMYRWARVPGGQDHWLDCVVGCYAAAFWLGISTDVMKQEPRKKRRISVQL